MTGRQDKTPGLDIPQAAQGHSPSGMDRRVPRTLCGTPGGAEHSLDRGWEPSGQASWSRWPWSWAWVDLPVNSTALGFPFVNWRKDRQQKQPPGRWGLALKSCQFPGAVMGQVGRGQAGSNLSGGGPTPQERALWVRAGVWWGHPTRGFPGKEALGRVPCGSFQWAYLGEACLLKPEPVPAGGDGSTSHMWGS